eukprot:CAMPEP_0172836548 /NCGR_PEP_ID=MMETSP1075-20121228/26551_1 /TAXON_ID=2916 /ORGANISM="Ceratium fusus, Strain PA161109" /LENGTH=550 /DNA_ID=CAMNT_0013679783 /DNA_START=85 /DNA_END=1737 /DNA_ORIENTATION=+
MRAPIITRAFSNTVFQHRAQFAPPTAPGSACARQTQLCLRATQQAGTWSSQQQFATNASAFDSAKARQLIEEILGVIRSAGPEAGAVRSFQAARAGLLTAVDLVRDGDAAELLAAFSSTSGRPSDQLLARVLRKLFERLGATYVKLGQFVASSPTLFPEAYVREFQKCLDSTEVTPFRFIEKTVERDLGRPISEVFRNFDPVPLASASIAQVHPAVLLTGEDVVVKVQKPGVRSTLQADLGFLSIATKVLGFLNPQLKRSSFLDIVEEVRENMLRELDFLQELQNLETFRKFLRDMELEDVAVAPKPYPDASSKRVLTMERLRGVSLIDLDGIRNYSQNPEGTLITALNVWALSVRGCDIFHADVHAGNLLVLEDGRVGFIDFGIVGRVPPEIWKAIEDVARSMATEDTLGMSRGLIAMGATDAEVDEQRLADDIRSVMASVRGLQPEVRLRGVPQGGRVTAEVGLNEAEVTDLLLEIVRVTADNGLKLPREFALLVKQALYFDRYTQLLAPELDPLTDDRVNIGMADSQPKANFQSGQGLQAAGTVIDV